MSSQEPPRKKRKIQDTWRRFRWTLNNPRPDEIKIFQDYLDNNTWKSHDIRYTVFQTKKAPTTGTIHLQGYTELKKRKRSSAIHKIPGFSRIALLAANASSSANIRYCTKTDTRVDGLSGSFGTPSRKESSNNRKELIQHIHNGGYSAKQAALDYPEVFLHAHAGIEKMISKLQEQRDFHTKVLIYYGPTGVGKSWKANHEHPSAYQAAWPTGTFWWDHYDGGNPNGTGHDTVIMDEFRNQIKMDVMLKLINPAPLPLQYKGGRTTFNSHRLIITTNIEPMDWYHTRSDDEFAMLKRRLITQCTIYEFSRPNKPEWQPDYQGSIQPKYEDIEYSIRTVPKERSVGPSSTEQIWPPITRDDQRMGRNIMLRRQQVRQRQAQGSTRGQTEQRLTGRKRKRESPVQSYASYGQIPEVNIPTDKDYF